MKKLTIEQIPLNDPYVYKYIGTGNTEGIFQIESAGMQDLMKKMFGDVAKKINNFEKKYNCNGFNPVNYYGKEKDNDLIENIKNNFLTEMKLFGDELFERIIAAISLYRPGPMDYIPDYIKGMNDPSSIHYDTPELEPILSRTYGVIVYQEQVQQIVRSLAGYSLGRGDLIRRAMSKKKTSVMNAEKIVFVNGNKGSKKADEAYVPGCVENGIEESAANIIWDKMAEFAKYAFNKSHSAGYAVITIQTAWMKLYYPLDFMLATLNSVITKQDKLKFYIASAQQMGIEILGPDVNKSNKYYTIENDKIRTGLMGLRNLGKMAQPIINERNNKGLFKNLYEFIDRLLFDIDKRVIESLIFSGALDCFEGTRNSKFLAVSKILGFTKDMKKGLYEDMHFKLPLVDKAYLNLKSLNIDPAEEFEKTYLLEKEYEFAGMFISGHPLDVYKEVLKANKCINLSDILPFEDEDSDEKIYSPYDGQKVTIAGIIRDLKQLVTSKGDKMYICSIEDKTSIIKCVIFPKVTSFCEEFIAEKNIVMLNGTIDDNERGCQVICDSLKLITDVDITKTDTLFINCSDYESIPKDLKDILTSETGDTTVKIKLKKAWVVCGNKFNLTWANFMKIKEMVPVELR